MIDSILSDHIRDFFKAQTFTNAVPGLTIISQGDNEPYDRPALVITSNGGSGATHMDVVRVSIEISLEINRDYPAGEGTPKELVPPFMEELRNKFISGFKVYAQPLLSSVSDPPYYFISKIFLSDSTRREEEERKERYDLQGHLWVIAER